MPLFIFLRERNCHLEQITLSPNDFYDSSQANDGREIEVGTGYEVGTTSVIAISAYPPPTDWPQTFQSESDMDHAPALMIHKFLSNIPMCM